MPDTPTVEKDATREALREALTPGLTEMLLLRFPAWNDSMGGYRYAEFIDRIAGIAADAGCVTREQR